MSYRCITYAHLYVRMMRVPQPVAPSTRVQLVGVLLVATDTWCLTRHYSVTSPYAPDYCPDSPFYDSGAFILWYVSFFVGH